MNKLWVAATVACLLTVGAIAQTPASGSATDASGQASAGASTSQSSQAGSAERANRSLNPGTTLQVELAKSIDAKKAKPGDEVTAKLTQDIKVDSTPNGVIRKGSKLVGHVTEAQAKTKENAESKLGVVFDKAVLKGGEEISFNGMIQALAPPIQGAPPVSSDDRSSTGSGMGSGGPSMGGGRSSGSMAPMGSGSNGAGSTMGSNNAAGSGANSAAGSMNNAPAVSATGQLNPASRGVVGMQGVSLSNSTSGKIPSSLISSANGNVKLDSGTQMILQVTGSAPVPAKP